MIIVYLCEGILIGFIMAVPIGAVGILCLRQTLTAGRRQAFVVGLAGATADFILSGISAFGIRLIYDFIKSHQYEIRLTGGILLLLMGVFLFRSKPAVEGDQKGIVDRSKIYFSTLVIALTNPLVVFGYAAVMSSVVGAEFFGKPWAVSTLVLGVFFGSLLWFTTISNLVHRFRVVVTEDKLAMVNRIAGILLVVIGLTSMWAGYQGLH